MQVDTNGDDITPADILVDKFKKMVHFDRKPAKKPAKQPAKQPADDEGPSDQPTKKQKTNG